VSLTADAATGAPVTPFAHRSFRFDVSHCQLLARPHALALK
jgi:hypothetical protein